MKKKAKSLSNIYLPVNTIMFQFNTRLFSNFVAGCACLILITLSTAPLAQAARGGGGGSGEMQFGIIAGVSQTTQDGMNLLATRANARTGVGPVSTGALNSAYEFGIQYGYRFSGSMFSLLFRPTYFMETTTGSGTGGSYNYGVTGFTFFPILRLVPLENEFMKFFLNLGLGYGQASSKIEEGSAQVSATGSAFGTLVGLGAEFCMTPVHCISLEGNYRYLTMDRNIASDASGTFASDSISQATTNREVELDGDDLKVRMGGLQFLAGYIIHF